jgi:hypothetical protein
MGKQSHRLEVACGGFRERSGRVVIVGCVSKVVELKLVAFFTYFILQ